MDLDLLDLSEEERRLYEKYSGLSKLAESDLVSTESGSSSEVMASSPVKTKSNGVISVMMIAESNLSQHVLESNSQDEIVEQLMVLKRVHLDHQNIIEIDNLEMLPSMTHLYLHSNGIRKLENLEFCMKLKYLGIQGNQIERLEGLEGLESLVMLDVSENLVTMDGLNADALPQSLKIINLKGNPCADGQEYQEILIDSLPNICEIDDRIVDDRAMEDLGIDDEDDYEENVKDEEAEGIRQAALEQNLTGLQQSDMLALYMSTVMSTTLTTGGNRTLGEEDESRIIQEQAAAVVHGMTSGVAERRRQRMDELKSENEKKMMMLQKDREWLDTELVESLDVKNSVGKIEEERG